MPYFQCVTVVDHERGNPLPQGVKKGPPYDERMEKIEGRTVTRPQRMRLNDIRPNTKGKMTCLLERSGRCRETEMASGRLRNHVRPRIDDADGGVKFDSLCGFGVFFVCSSICIRVCLWL